LILQPLQRNLKSGLARTLHMENRLKDAIFFVILLGEIV